MPDLALQRVVWDPAAVQDNTFLWIQKGEYRINASNFEAHRFPPRSNIVIYCEPGVVFIDEGQTAVPEKANMAGTAGEPDTGATLIRSPYGIRFTDSKDVRWLGYAEFRTSGGGLGGAAPYKWGTSNYMKRNPAIFFDNCDGCEWEGYLNMNPGIGISARPYKEATFPMSPPAPPPPPLTPAERLQNGRNAIAPWLFSTTTPTAEQYQSTSMRGYPFHAYKCRGLKINLRGFGEFSTREQIGIVDCTATYLTGGNTRLAPNFDASYFKLLSNHGLVVENIVVKAYGTASLMDVSGENIEVRSINGTFTDGAKAVDYTQEWGAGGNVNNSNATISGVRVPDECFIAVTATNDEVAINHDLTIRDSKGRLSLPSTRTVRVYDTELRNSTNAQASADPEQVFLWYDCQFVWNAGFAVSAGRNLFRLGRRMRFQNCTFVVESSAVTAGMTKLVFRPTPSSPAVVERLQDRWVEFDSCKFTLASGCILELATNTRLSNTVLPAGWIKGTTPFNGDNDVQRNADLVAVTP